MWISAVASGARFYTNGAVQAVDFTDPGLSVVLPPGVPALPAWGLLALLGLLALALRARVGFARRDSR